MYIENNFLTKLNNCNGIDLDNIIKCGMTFNKVTQFYYVTNYQKCTGHYDNDNIRISSTQIVVGYSKKLGLVYVRDLIDRYGQFVFFNSHTYAYDLNYFLALLGIANRTFNNKKMNKIQFEYHKHCKPIVFGKHYVKSEKVAEYTLKFIETLVNNPLPMKDYKPKYRWYGYQIDYSKELQALKKEFKKDKIYF